jgi:AraC family ethanolamine operon transcriptional activator
LIIRWRSGFRFTNLPTTHSAAAANLIPDPEALPMSIQISSQSDLDRFRPVMTSVMLDYTPMVRTIATRQAILSLPGCTLYHLQTFPKIIDVALDGDRTLVGLTMSDDFPVYINGWRKDRPALVIGRSGAGCKLAEPVRSDIGVIIFDPAIENPDWPRSGEAFATLAITEQAQRRLRDLIRAAFHPALRSFDQDPTFAMDIRDNLAAAVSEAIADGDAVQTRQIAKRERYFQLVQELDRYFAAHLDRPIYNQEQAQRLGVSVRTLSNAVNQSCGLSLHRYLRLKRLWLVRKALLAGRDSIKACALAHGFWHMSDFTTAYRSQFGETPSQTRERC